MKNILVWIIQLHEDFIRLKLTSSNITKHWPIRWLCMRDLLFRVNFDCATERTICVLAKNMLTRRIVWGVVIQQNSTLVISCNCCSIVFVQLFDTLTFHITDSHSIEYFYMKISKNSSLCSLLANVIFLLCVDLKTHEKEMNCVLNVNCVSERRHVKPSMSASKQASTSRCRAL